MAADGHGVSLWGNDGVLEQERSAGHTAVQMCRRSPCPVRWLILYELYVD